MRLAIFPYVKFYAAQWADILHDLKLVMLPENRFNNLLVAHISLSRENTMIAWGTDSDFKTRSRRVRREQDEGVAEEHISSTGTREGFVRDRFLELTSAVAAVMLAALASICAIGGCAVLRKTPLRPGGS